jgi:hypothetical protein
MTDTQLYLAIGVPILANAAMFGLLMAYINARFDGIRGEFNERFNAVNQRFDGVNQGFDGVNQRFDGVNQRFDGVNQRFDDMRDLWRAELRRVEEVLDARLKHLEEK